MTKGEVRLLHGAMSYLVQVEDGPIIKPLSINTGFDYIRVDVGKVF